MEMAGSQSLREDMRHLAAGRQNPLIKNGRVDLDKLVEFLCCYNEFINHRLRPFKPMIDKLMKL